MEYIEVNADAQFLEGPLLKALGVCRVTFCLTKMMQINAPEVLPETPDKFEL